MAYRVGRTSSILGELILAVPLLGDKLLYCVRRGELLHSSKYLSDFYCTCDTPEPWADLAGKKRDDLPQLQFVEDGRFPSLCSRCLGGRIVEKKMETTMFCLIGYILGLYRVYWKRNWKLLLYGDDRSPPEVQVHHPAMWSPGTFVDKLVHSQAYVQSFL